jgi:hypothetical protein
MIRNVKRNVNAYSRVIFQIREIPDTCLNSVKHSTKHKINSNLASTATTSLKDFSPATGKFCE